MRPTYGRDIFNRESNPRPRYRVPPVYPRQYSVHPPYPPTPYCTVADVVSAVNRVCGIDGWLRSATECWVKGHAVAADAESVGSVARPTGVFL